MERTKICKCAHDTGKLMSDISDIKGQVKSMRFGNIDDIEASNIKRHLELLQRRIGSVRNMCNLDTTHQEDTANNISKGTSFMIKMSDRYEFEIEKSMILNNLGDIKDQIIMKLDDCSKEKSNR